MGFIDYQALQRERDVASGKAGFQLLFKGTPEFGPRHFDRRMDILDLTPRHIGQTDETIVAAKREWQVSRGKQLFQLLESKSIRDSEFDEAMDDLDLTPEDIGQTDETIAAAKRQDNVTPLTAIDPETLPAIGLETIEFEGFQRFPGINSFEADSCVSVGKEVFRRMAEGDPPCSPTLFDRMIETFGLRPADIDETAESIAAAKSRWNMTREPLTAIGPEKLAGTDLEALDVGPAGEVNRAPDDANG